MSPRVRGLRAVLLLVALALFVGWWANPNRGLDSTEYQGEMTLRSEHPDPWCLNERVRVCERVVPFWVKRACVTRRQVNCYQDAPDPYYVRAVRGRACRMYVDRRYARVHDRCTRGGVRVRQSPAVRAALPYWMTRPCSPEGGIDCFWDAQTQKGGHSFAVHQFRGRVCVFYTQPRYSARHDYCA